MKVVLYYYRSWSACGGLDWESRRIVSQNCHNSDKKDAIVIIIVIKIVKKSRNY